MSILSKGMKMPECCDVCRFGEWSTLHQTACCKLKEYEPCFAEFSKEYRSKRADFCPLVALPDHHRRLIDAFDMKAKAFDKRNGLIHWSDINDAPTVIEAEDGT